MKAISRSRAGASSGTATGSAKPTVARPCGVMTLLASPSTYSASGSATLIGCPVAAA